MNMQKFKFSLKKKSLLYTALTGIVVSSLTLTTAMANNPTPPAPPIGQIVAAINQLGNKIEALDTAGAKTANNTMYQTDQNLPMIVQTNAAKALASVNVAQQNSATTAEQIKNSLQQIPDSALTFTIQTDDVTDSLNRQQQQQNLIDQLTLNTPASDTLYSDVLGIDASTADTQGYSMAKPKTLYDNYFDFNSLFNPTAYTTQQKQAAQNYLEYFTKEYASLTAAVNFDKLKSKLNKLKSTPNELAKELFNFVNSDSFKQYQISIRSMMAARSLALSNFNHLIAERSPIETTDPNPSLDVLSQAIGLKPNYHGTFYDPNLKKYVYASPLQIANYTANHRVNDSNWYQQMSTASPATVQRETLYVLAEIESQMYQAHLDRERLIATLTAMQAGTSAGDQMMLQTQANAVNQTIDSLGKTDKSTSSNSQANSASNLNSSGNVTNANPTQGQ